jgi:glycogen synthase
MRVHVVCAEVPPHVVGGLGRYAERTLGRLAAEVPVTVHAQDGARPARRGARLVARNLAYTARSTARILASPRRGAVVAVHDWMGCLTGLACRLAGRPVVFHVHNRELSTAPRTALGRGLAALEAAMARLAAATIVPTSTMRTELAARGWPRVRVVPHGAGDPGPDRLPDDVRARYPAGPLLVYAGRYSAAKGVPTLLDALTRLPGVTLVLCGDGSPHTAEAADVAALIADLGLAGRAIALRRFLPAAELAAHFLAADACVFPSTYEPFGLVAVEAMALGRPVVVGPGYAPEVAGPARRCAADDPAELAELIGQALADPAAGPAGREHARSFDWDRTVAATLRCYAEAVAR